MLPTVFLSFVWLWRLEVTHFATLIFFKNFNENKNFHDIISAKQNFCNDMLLYVTNYIGWRLHIDSELSKTFQNFHTIFDGSKNQNVKY